METKKIEVQSFLMQDTAKIMIDEKEKELWLSLVKKLNLKNQSFECENKENKNQNPFLFLKTHQKNIIETLCPIKTDYKDYDKGIIPIEILMLIDMSEKEGYFDKICISYDDLKPDPICTGEIHSFHCYNNESPNLNYKTFRNKEEAIENGFIQGKDSGYENIKDIFLIGRWGDEKKDFETLANEAAKKYFKLQMNEINKQKDNLKYNIFDKFGVEYIDNI